MESQLNTWLRAPLVDVECDERLIDDLVEASQPVPSECPYDKTLLDADDRGEVLVMTWNPGVRCAPHGHDEARGVM